MSPTPAAPTELPPLEKNGSSDSRPAAVSSSSLDILSRSAESSSNADLDLLASLFPFPAPTQVSPVLSSSSNNDPPSQDLATSSTSTSAILATMKTPFMTSAMLGVATPAGGAVPEFLYQLTKMLTDNNRDVIEWSNAMIKVHNPLKLESQILHRYFRHSKFSSFQRQLNYFGFRKLAGKGKMAPCSYVNESAGQDIGSLLLIKRKSGASVTTGKDKLPAPKPLSVVKRETPVTAIPNKPVVGTSHPPERTTNHHHPPPLHRAGLSSSSHVAIARSAVGRGIRHGLSAASTMPSVPLSAEAVADPIREARESSLSQLETNFQHSLNDAARSHNDSETSSKHSHQPTPKPSPPLVPEAGALQAVEAKLDKSANISNTHNPSSETTSNDPFVGFLTGDSSLVDLAMIPTVEDEDHENDKRNHNSTSDTIASENQNNLTKGSFEWGFVDFPNPEVDPRLRQPRTDDPS